MRSLLFVLVATGTAAANPRPLPFTFTSDTIAPDRAELEQTVDLDPLRAVGTGGTQRYVASQLQTEIVYGLDDRLELRIGFTLAPSLADELTETARLFEGNGLEQRLRYGLADVGEWPLDVGLMVQAVENDHETRFAGTLLLQRRFDRLRIAANAQGQYALSYDKQRSWLVTPSAGATYDVADWLSVGVDSWLRGEYPQNPTPATRTFALGPEAYVGPSVQVQLGNRLWWTVAVYARVTDRSHDVAPGDPFGEVWVRTLLGYAL